MTDYDWISVSGSEYREEVSDLDLPTAMSPSMKDKMKDLSVRLDMVVRSITVDFAGGDFLSFDKLNCFSDYCMCCFCRVLSLSLATI